MSAKNGEGLTFESVDAAGEHVVLRNSAGKTFRLPITTDLLTALRAINIARPTPPAPASSSSGTLSPKEIQSRVRAGASAEEIAQSWGLDIELVRRFEGPILAERSYIVELAQQATVRRYSGAGPSTLEASVAQHLATKHPGARRHWDSYRGEDSSWVITLHLESSEAPGQLARWRFDVASRHVDAMNEAAEIMTGQPSSTVEAPVSHASTVPGTKTTSRLEQTGAGPSTPTSNARPPATPEPARQDRGPAGGPRAISTEPSTLPAAADGSDLLESLQARRGRRGAPVDVLDDADPLDGLVDQPAPGGSSPTGAFATGESNRRAHSRTDRRRNRRTNVGTTSSSTGSTSNRFEERTDDDLSELPADVVTFSPTRKKPRERSIDLRNQDKD